MRLYSTVGKKGGNYDYELIGYNYKMTSLHASIGNGQLDNINNIILKKKKIRELYEYYFKESFPIIMPNNFCIQLKNSSEFNNSVKIPNLGLKQINKTIKKLRSNTSSSNEASNVLLSYLR